MSDAEAIRSAIGRYGQLVDDGEFDEWGDLFEDDAELDVSGHVLRGRAAILEFIRSSYGDGGSTHLFGASDIRVAGDEASAATDFLFVQNDGKPVGVGRTQDEWVRSGDGWRLRRRAITLKR
ncbi:MAG TPA: nuclear transport factor 2 family protein [Acidimicrobiia bacterium]|nr:nuclear transport factor 2 family protein [Acidimicrobiia bacterium]